jgi:hypothetical protein
LLAFARGDPAQHSRQWSAGFTFFLSFFSLLVSRGGWFAQKKEKKEKSSPKKAKKASGGGDKKEKASFEEVQQKIKDKGLDKLNAEDLKIIIRHENEKLEDKSQKTALGGKKDELLERVKGLGYN